MNKVVSPSRSSGKPGDTLRYKGYTFCKSVNGKWQLVWSTKDKARIKSFYTDGMTLREIAEHYGVSHSLIQSVVRRTGIQRSHYGALDRQARWVKDYKVQLLEAYHRGHTLPVLAKVLGIRQDQLALNLKKYGLEECRFARKTSMAKIRAKEFTLTGRSAADWNRILSEDTYASFKAYRKAVRRLTALARLRYGSLALTAKINKGDDHVDHMYSIHRGFYNAEGIRRPTPVSVRLLAHPKNLEAMSGVENSRKGMSCSLTLKELKIRISKWEARHSVDTWTLIESPEDRARKAVSALGIPTYGSYVKKI